MTIHRLSGISWPAASPRIAVCFHQISSDFTQCIYILWFHIYMNTNYTWSCIPGLSTGSVHEHYWPAAERTTMTSDYATTWSHRSWFMHTFPKTIWRLHPLMARNSRVRLLTAFVLCGDFICACISSNFALSNRSRSHTYGFHLCNCMIAQFWVLAYHLQTTGYQQTTMKCGVTNYCYCFQLCGVLNCASIRSILGISEIAQIGRKQIQTAFKPVATCFELLSSQISHQHERTTRCHQLIFWHQRNHTNRSQTHPNCFQPCGDLLWASVSSDFTSAWTHYSVSCYLDTTAWYNCVLVTMLPAHHAHFSKLTSGVPIPNNAYDKHSWRCRWLPIIWYTVTCFLPSGNYVLDKIIFGGAVGSPSYDIRSRASSPPEILS